MARKKQWVPKGRRTGSKSASDKKQRESEVQKYVRTFLKKLPHTKEDYYYDAMEYMNAGDLNGSARLLRKALEIDEHYVEAYVGLTWVYRQKGNEKKREEYVERALEETKKLFPKWKGIREWAWFEHRPYLRAIGEKGMMHADRGDNEEAEKWYRLLLKLNPNDNQGIRYLIAAMLEGISGEEVDEMTHRGNEKQDWSEQEEMVERQNKKHKFWEPPELE